MECRERINIPIYDIFLNIYIGENIYEERKKYDDVFGPHLDGPDESDFGALCSYNLKTGNFMLLFDLDDFSIGSLSHEIFHMTHRMMEYIGIEYCEESGEAFAYLNEYLFENIYSFVKEYL